MNRSNQPARIEVRDAITLEPITLYKDQECTVPYEGKGVLIIDPDGKVPVAFIDKRAAL